MRDLGLGGKRVIVTGAAGGLGRAFAEAFAAERRASSAYCRKSSALDMTHPLVMSPRSNDLISRSACAS